MVEDFIDDNYTSTPIQYENMGIDTDEVSEYIAVTDIQIDTEQIDTDTVKVEGAIVIQIHTEIGEGTDRGRELGKELATLLEREEMNNLNFKIPIFESVGSVEGTSYYQHNLTVPYAYGYAAATFNVC